MKKVLWLFLSLIILGKLSGLTIDLNNIDLEIVDTDNYSQIKTSKNNHYNTQPGTPALPLNTIFFEVPADSKIANFTVIPQEINRIKLKNRLLPVQQAVPLLADFAVKFTEANPEIYNSSIYPQDLVFNFAEGFCGNRSIGYASIFAVIYYPQEQILEIPGSFHIDIEFTPAAFRNQLPAGKVSDKIAFELGLEEQYRNESDESYLMITTQQFLPAFEDLLDWRQTQGVNVFWITTDEIENQYTGRDLQEKVRNCIIDYYQNYQITFVTLGGDVDHIPDRKVFAFDCEFGAYEDENDIPSDMYYSCLQGNWDANNNNVFGEDADEIDYFPEVYVARIPVNTISEIEDYVTRLIYYESGEVEDYNKASGFSMQLWPGSNSEICQQYIYDMYFPDYYDIQLFYGEENNQQNAYEIMNSGQNLIQHTGHAGRLSMSLESGRIRLDDIDSLYNEWGGLFYSIGCWSAAIDYNSIGENLVSQIDRGFLGYVGNSRYGWGAPSASGFGFSEFFQKAFFRDLFAGNTRLGELNALQKLDFIPYYSGTSVYKWVAYELNALGDAYLNLNISNPVEMNYSLFLNNDQYHIIVSDANGPLSDVLITGNEVSIITDNTGEAIIPANTTETELVLFKTGYKTIFLEFPGMTDDFLIEFSECPDDLSLVQGEFLPFEVEFTNFSLQDQQFLVVYEYNSEELSLDYSNATDFIEAGSTINLAHLDISLNPISESYQMPNDKKLYFNVKVFSVSDNNLLAERQLEFSVAAPDIVIDQFVLESDLIFSGTAVPVHLSLVNTGSIELFGLAVEFSSTSPFLQFEEPLINLDNYLDIGDELLLDNVINIDNSAPSDLQTEIQVNLYTNSHDQTYTFQKTLFLAAGQIYFTDNFDSVDMWQIDPQWQLVSSEFYSADYSLSCRPEFVGNYLAESPLLSYLPGMEIAFQYKYKMPMYGNDGVYVMLETENSTDTLLFLGSGGALPENDRTPETYIAGDWAEYQLYLDDVMPSLPAPGTQFSVVLKFTVPEILEDFNEYSEIEDIGVFFDDFKIGQPQLNPEPLDNDILLVYPNPSSAGKPPRFSLYNRESHPLKMKIYDIKGRLVSEMNYRGLGTGKVELFWDGKDLKQRNSASGIYIIIIDNGFKKYRGKFIYIN